MPRQIIEITIKQWEIERKGKRKEERREEKRREDQSNRN
jgi:hypothetical protein